MKLFGYKKRHKRNTAIEYTAMGTGKYAKAKLFVTIKI